MTETHTYRETDRQTERQTDRDRQRKIQRQGESHGRWGEGVGREKEILKNVFFLSEGGCRKTDTDRQKEMGTGVFGLK